MRDTLIRTIACLALAFTAAPALAAPALPAGPFALVGATNELNFYLKTDSAQAVDDGVDFTLLVVMSPPRDAGRAQITYAVVREHVACRARTYFGRGADMYDEAGGLIGSVEKQTEPTAIDTGSPMAVTAGILCDGAPSAASVDTPAQALTQARARAPAKAR